MLYSPPQKTKISSERNLLGKSEGNRPLETPRSEGGRTVLGRMLRNAGARIWTGRNWSIDSVASCCEHDNETLGSINTDCDF
jgi:hypothetical protein